MSRRRCSLLAVALLITGCGNGGGDGARRSSTASTTRSETVTRTTASSTAPPPTSSPRAATSSPVRHCRTAQLSARLVFDRGGASAGHTEAAVLLRNVSRSTCSLHGYAGVSFVGAGGRQLGAAAARAPADREPTVVIQAQQSAGAPLELVDVGAYSDASCHSTTARGLRVYPPDEREALFAPHATETCLVDGRRVASVGPIQELVALPAGVR